MKGKKDNTTIISVPVKDYEIPLKIIIERRNNIRVALGKESAILRVPFHVKTSMDSHIGMAHSWLLKLSEKSPELLNKYHIDQYSKNKSLLILGRDEYRVTVVHTDKSDGSIGLQNMDITLNLPKNLNHFQNSKLARELISRLFIKRYKKIVVDRVNLWNGHFFKKQIKGVTLRYNNSNWGSCSSSGQISISTRCLLLPLDVFDYIIIHELSHLIELNHSSKFWSVVKAVMPDYENKEKWLKKNGGILDY